MYSAKIDSHTFFNDISRYIREKNLPINDTPVMDIVLENPDMQRLISIWLQTKNEGQLNYLLVDTVNNISLMNESEQSQALNDLLSRAQLLNAVIPSPSDLDMVLDSMGEKPREVADGWSDFNLPLAEISSEIGARFQDNAFFINGGLFTANVLAGMTEAQKASFDKRKNELIKEHADFLYPDRIFSDKLLQLLKSDPAIRNLLKEVQAVQPFPSEYRMVNDISDDLLAQYLGLDEEDSTTNEDLSSLSEDSTIDLNSHNGKGNTPQASSPLSDATTVQERDVSAKKAKSGATEPLTFWQHFNIEAHELQALIRIGEINPHEIPDRELTDREAAVYRMMNRLNQDLNPLDHNALSSGSEISSRTSSESFSRDTAQEYQPKDALKQKKSTSKQDKFLTDCKDTTHNKYYQNRNREYKERMQERYRRAYGEDEPPVSNNPGSKPKFKF